MKNYLTILGKKAKKASTKSVISKKKNKVLQDYCKSIFNNKLNIIRENKKDLKIAKNKKLKNLKIQSIKY